MDMNGVYAYFCEALCDVTTVPSQIKSVQIWSIFRLISPLSVPLITDATFPKFAPKHFTFDKLSDKNRLKVAFQVSKFAFSPIVMP